MLSVNDIRSKKTIIVNKKTIELRKLIRLSPCDKKETNIFWKKRQFKIEKLQTSHKKGEV